MKSELLSLLLLLLGMTTIIGVNGEDAMLIRLPTMDYSVSLGDVYDYTRESFTGENIFPELPPSTAVRVETVSEVKYGLKIFESLEEKLQFLEMELSAGVEALSEAQRPLGARRYLLEGSSEAGAGDVEAVVFRKMSTVRELVNVFGDPMSTNIYKDVLEESRGTHVVVGITYGSWTLAGITFRNSLEQGTRVRTRSELKQLLWRKYEGTEEDVTADDDESAPSPGMSSSQQHHYPYTVEYFGDGKLSQGKPRSVSAIKRYLEDPENMPEGARENGRGPALAYYLRPLKDLHQTFHHEETHNKPFFEISQPDLKAILNAFEDIGAAQRALTTLRREFLDVPCTTPEDNTFIRELSLRFQQMVWEYKASLRANLTSIKSSGYITDEEDGAELFGYDFGNFAPTSVAGLAGNRTELLREKVRDCRSVVGRGMEMITSEEGLKNLLGQHEKIIQVLYFSPELIQKNRDLWRANLELALKLKKSASNKVVAFYCDGGPCNGLTSTVLEEYIGGVRVSQDVRQALEAYQPLPQLKLTLGVRGNAQLGDLFNSARGTFLKSPTLFPPELLWEESPKVQLPVCAIYEYSFEGLFQALGAESVEQLQALKDEEAFEAGKTVLVAQIVSTEQWIKTLGTPVVTKDLHNLNKATHFVTKVVLGTNLFFQSTNPQEERASLAEAKPVLCQALDAISRGLSVQNFPLELSSLNLTLSEDFRPNTWRTPLTNDNLASYFSSILERKNPIQYDLEPIQNLQAQLGVLPNITTFSDKAATAEVVKAVTAARVALDDPTPYHVLKEFLDFLVQNQDCISSQKLELVKSLVQNYEQGLKGLRSNFTSQINHFLDGSLSGPELESWAKDFSSKVPTKSKVREDINISFENHREKIRICKMLAPGHIKYAKSLESLHLEQIQSASTKEIYILLLRGKWISSNSGKWSENLSKFLGVIAKGKHQLVEDLSAAKLIMFDCDSAPEQDSICRGRSQPVILGYKNGVLVNEDVAELIQAEEIGNRVFLETLSKTITDRLNNIPPEGFIYIQYHNQLQPQALWPHLTWEEVTPTYEGQFFRAAGGSAAAFGKEQPGQYPGIRDIGKVVLNHDETQESCTLSTTRNCSIIVGDSPGESSSLATKALWAGMNRGESGGSSPKKATVPKAESRPQSTRKETIRFGYEQKEVWPRNSAIRIWKRV